MEEKANHILQKTSPKNSTTNSRINSSIKREENNSSNINNNIPLNPELNTTNKLNKSNQETKENNSKFNMLTFAKGMISISNNKQEEKNLIIIGDKGSGKSTIFNNILNINSHKENYNPTSGINFNFLRQQNSQKKFLLNLYEIGGGLDNMDLIRTIINEENFSNTFFIFVLDFKKPENVLKSFKDFVIKLSKILKEIFSQEILLEIIEKKKNMFVDRNVNMDYKRLTFFPAEIFVIGNKYDALEIREM